MTNETNYNGNKLTLSPKCDKTTQLPHPTTTSEDNNGVMGLRVGFININDMYNNDVGKGVVYAYEAYEAK
jgi:hypothetical protein